MQQELCRQKRQSIPDNNKVMERVRSPVDFNKLSMEAQPPSATMKSKKNQILKPVDSVGRFFSCTSRFDRHNESYESFSKTKSPYYRNIIKSSESNLNNKLQKKIEVDKTLLKKNNVNSYRQTNNSKNSLSCLGKENLNNNCKNFNVAANKKNNYVNDKENNIKSKNKKKSAFAFMRLKSKKNESKNFVKK